MEKKVPPPGACRSDGTLSFGKIVHSKKKAAESKKNINDILLDGSQNEKNPVNMINDININTNANMAPTFDLNKEKNNIIE